MKKYLKEIETSGIVLLFLGVILGRMANMELGAMISVVGLLLWVLTVVVKAFNWQQYRRDNILNIIIMLGAIVAIFFTLTLMK
jgi:uncharacterized membrane protein